MTRLMRSVLWLLVIVDASALVAEEKPYGLAKRVPWTSSKVLGSPDPPLPYTVEPVFTDIDWDRPLYVKAVPGTNELLVIQQGGEEGRPSTVLRIDDRPSTQQVTTVLRMDGRLIYALEFHPAYEENGYVFVFSNGPTGNTERMNRVSRFVLSATEPRLFDSDSEQVIIEWRSMGHDGGDLVFGHDGMLYIASGDGTADSDRWLSAQDVSNLLGTILRIDVDRATADLSYAIPQDNPFLDVEHARGEIWAFGLRNPWRMTIDAKTGQIWVGNNGQDLWETAHLVRRGDNYGWSVYEGSHPFYIQRQMGPAPYVPPTIEHHHTEARSLTGGVVYYGDRLPKLAGTYVYGDYATGKIWGARHDGKRLTWHRELADTSLQIAAFGLSHRGDLLVVDNGGGLFRLVINTNRQVVDFPTRLSETGLFASVKRHAVAPGVIPYSVNAEGWNDGAKVQRYLAIPHDLRVDYTSTRGWNFPDGTVLMQTLALAEINSARPRRIETRLLTRQQGEWAGYSYRWNEQQSDAWLVERGGDEMPIASGHDLQRTWRFPSRAECMSCHSRAANFVLGLSELQMNRVHAYGTAEDNQLRTFAHIGLFRDNLAKPISQMPRLVDPYDLTVDLDRRARSYLHANCASCHVEAGGGNSRMEFEFSTPLEQVNVVEVHPQHDTFGIERAMLVAPGDPDRSILYQRIRRRGRGQMPPLVSRRVDEDAAELFRQWILQLKPARRFVKDWQADDLRPALATLFENRSFSSGRGAYRIAGCIQCHRFQDEGGGAGPDLTKRAPEMNALELLESVISPSQKIQPDYATTVLILSDGRTLEGRIEAETADEIVVRSGASFATAERIPKAEVEERFLSKTSSMPVGTLNYLEQHQVLDLFAYLLTGGNRNHRAFAQND